jgi:hypothetical protein
MDNGGTLECSVGHGQVSGINEQAMWALGYRFGDPVSFLADKFLRAESVFERRPVKS